MMHRFGKPGGQIFLELEQWPVVVLRARGDSFTDEALNETIEVYQREMQGRTGTFVTVQDLRECSGLPPKQRAILSEGMKRSESINARCRGHALVIANPLLRGMLTAILWLKKPVYEIAVFGNAGEAMAWAQTKVSATDVARAV